MEASELAVTFLERVIREVDGPMTEDGLDNAEYILKLLRKALSEVKGVEK